MSRYQALVAACILSISIIDTSRSFDGFYIGGQVGLTLIRGMHVYSRSIKGTITPLVGPVYFDEYVYGNHRMPTQSLSYLGGFQAGYTGEIGTSKTLLGLEVYSVFPGGKNNGIMRDKFGLKDGIFEIQHKNAYGLAFILGTVINPKVSLRLRLGMERGTFQASYKDLSILYFRPPRFSVSKNVNAFVVGVEGAYKLSRNFIIAVDISVPFYKKITFATRIINLVNVPLLLATVRGDQITTLTYMPREIRAGLKLMFSF